jgi:hypothetical protein
MKLEPIDTSTTAGKARVMQLAAEGRKVAVRPREKVAFEAIGWIDLNGDSDEWDWPHYQYAIIAEQVGPDEVWAVSVADHIEYFSQEKFAEKYAKSCDGAIVRYRRVEE